MKTSKTSAVLLACCLAGCAAHYDPRVGNGIGLGPMAATPEAISNEGRNVSAELSACVAADSLFLGTEWAGSKDESISNQHSMLEPIRLAYQAANCYEAYARGVASDPARSADERVVITLAAERSVLAVDPDPLDRMTRAARLADLAARQFGDRGDDDERIDASLRAAWYAARTKDLRLRRTSVELWTEVAKSDVAFKQSLGAQAAAWNSLAMGAMNQVVAMGGAASAMSGVNRTLAQVDHAVAKAQDVAQKVITIVKAGSEGARMLRALAEGRADLGMLLRGGPGVLGGLVPQLAQRVPAFRELPAAMDVVQDVDAAARGDTGADSRLLVRMAHAFGAERPRQLVSAAATAASVAEPTSQGAKK